MSVLFSSRGMIVEHWRGEQQLEDLVNTESYSYDNPVTYRHVTFFDFVFLLQHVS